MFPWIAICITWGLLRTFDQLSAVTTEYMIRSKKQLCRPEAFNMLEDNSMNHASARLSIIDQLIDSPVMIIDLLKLTQHVERVVRMD